MQLTIDGVTREPITSTNLESIGYEPDRQVLAVEFKSGLVLHYSNVNLNLATDLYGATSRGAFYAKFIRGKFIAKTMTGPCNVCRANGVISEPCAECGEGRHFMVERQQTQELTSVDDARRI